MTHDERQAPRSSTLADLLSDTMRNRPEALLLLAAGTALLMTRGRGFGLSELMSGSAGSRRAGSRIGERLHAATDTATHLASDMREAADDYAERAGQRVEETREALTRRTGAIIERARASVQENIDYMLHEQPLALGAVSLLAGIAIGAALPRTALEADALGVARAPLEGGQSRREAFRSAASEVGETMKDVFAGGPSAAGAPARVGAQTS